MTDRRVKIVDLRMSVEIWTATVTDEDGFAETETLVAATRNEADELLWERYGDTGNQLADQAVRAAYTEGVGNGVVEAVEKYHGLTVSVAPHRVEIKL